MKTKTWFLPLFLGTSLASIYFLPKVGSVALSAINMTLPAEFGTWVFKNIPASKDEMSVLAPDTEFSKAICFSARPGEFNLEGYAVPDRVDLSIVLSGADINNSIHRPERCMPAQGHLITSSRSDILKLPNGREFPVKRLVSVQTPRDAEGRPSSQNFDCITYYFFVGHDRISNDHLGRTLLDMKDRLVRGMDQRWAYISVSMWYGKVPWIEQEVTEAEADAKIRAFLTNFAEEQIKWDQILP
ncbi:MAG: exosortase-associated EpsI family protein [Verrucomicrobiaceae bacterium]|nr:MAG: exosortase-associated EpsI family protein [Verrucomicrobiaceae bacterium]